MAKLLWIRIMLWNNLNKKYEFNWGCRGETFWIYSDSKWIEHRQPVQIMYSTKPSGKGYWLSRYHNFFYPSYWADTKTCPGGKFYGIRRDCGQELWEPAIFDRSVKNYPNLYDGELIKLDNIHYEIYLYKCEGLENDMLSQPFTYVRARGWVFVQMKI